MTRVTLGAVLVLAAAGAAHAGDGFALGFSIGFPIGDCGFGTIGIGTGAWGWGGWGGGWGGYPAGSCYPAPSYCAPGPSYCDRGWYDDGPYSRGYARRGGGRRDGRYGYGYSSRYANADSYAEPISAVDGRPLQPVARVAAATPKAVSPAETESAAWKALGAGDALAMEQFSRLVIRADATSSAAMGYAIAAAGAGQADRAAWAAREAMKSSNPLAGIPADAATKAAIASALAYFEASARPGTRDSAVVVAAMKAASGDHAGAALALEAAAGAGESVQRLASLGNAVGATITEPKPGTVVSAK